MFISKKTLKNSFLIGNTIKSMTAAFVSAVILCGVSVWGQQAVVTDEINTDITEDTTSIVGVPNVPQSTDAAPNIKINIPVDDVVLGDLVYLDIVSDSSKDIFGYEFIVDYNKDILEYKATDFFDLKKNTDIDTETENDTETETENETESNKKNGVALSKGMISNVLQGDKGLCVFCTSVEGYDIDDSNNKTDADIENKDEDAEVSKNLNTTESNKNTSDLKSVNFKKQSVNKNNTLCTIAFAIKKYGETDVIVSSVKTVYDDMTYYKTDKKFSVTVKIDDPSKKEDTNDKNNNKRPGGGGGISFGGGVSSVGAPKPDTDDNSDNSNNNTDNTDDAENSHNSENLQDTLIFNDTDKNHWAYDSILKMSEKGIINGFEDGSFRPDDFITRAEFCEILFMTGNFNTEDLLKENTSEKFSDVTDTDWFYKEVSIMANANIVNGSDGLFLPNDNITRQDAAVMVRRFIDYNKIIADKTSDVYDFADKIDISDYAADSVNYLCGIGILKGDENNKFNPMANMTRAEAATVILRLSDIGNV